MKYRIVLGALLTSSAISAQAQEVAAAGPQVLDATYGFRGARFETALSDYPDMVLAEKAGRTRYYRRTGEKKQFGQGQVADITYGFYQGKLAVVLLKTQGEVNSQAVLEELQWQAGPGTQHNPFAQRYSWDGQQVQLSYDENALSNDALIVLTCKKLKEHELKQQLRNQPTTPAG
jgi:hypothetical protein